MAFDTSGIDDAKFYTVTLTGSLEITPKDFAHPGDHVRLRGDLVKLHVDMITEAVETNEG